MTTTKKRGDVHVIDNRQCSSFLSEFQQGRPAPSEQSSADAPIRFSLFPNERAQSARFLTRPGIAELAACIRGTKAPTKDRLPLANFTRVNGAPNQHGCVRYAKAVIELTGAAADYDRGEMPIADAAARLQAAGLEAVLSETPSSTPEKPRWRAWCPAARAHTGTPEELQALLSSWVARVNGLLGGSLDPASFNLAQSYYIGSIEGKPAKVLITKGARIDTLDHLDEGAIYKNGPAQPPPAIEHAPVPEDLTESDDDPRLLRECQLRARGFAKRWGNGTTPTGERAHKLVQWLADVSTSDGLTPSAGMIHDVIQDAYPRTHRTTIEGMLERRRSPAAGM
jgi:hypothetical protein